MRKIFAAYDDSGIDVYQAFTPAIVQQALEIGTFGDRFKLERMTWIKPSFGWMLYRCGYAAKPDQEAVLKIKLSHDGFRTILQRAVPSSYEPGQFASSAEWQRAVKHSTVRYQWDPDRNLAGGKLEQRALQLGLSATTVREYVSEWIIDLEDVTALAQSIGAAVRNKRALDFDVPDEREYPVDAAIQEILGMNR
jgi:hypothetical protein